MCYSILKQIVLLFFHGNCVCHIWLSAGTVYILTILLLVFQLKKIGRREDTYHELLSSLDVLDAKEREIYGDAVLQVVTEANEARIDKWKEEISMTCEALERIMAPELKAKELQGRLEGKIEGKVLAFAEVGLSVRKIADRVSLSVEEVEKILADN